MDLTPIRRATFALLTIVSGTAGAWDLVPDRRRAQFQHEPGHAVFPYVFSLPGIGKGYGILGAVTNVGGSYTDLAGTLFTGDVNGQAVGVNGLHVLPRRLILDFGGVHLSRTTVQSYFERGMTTGRDDYSLAEFGSSIFWGGRATATFWDRRAEAFVGSYGGRATFESLRDRDGNLIADASGGSTFRADTLAGGIRLDLTDDYVDPRQGVQVQPSVWRSPPRGSGPDFYFAEASATAYIPFGRWSTVAVNYFRSDAHVLRAGETDTGRLADELGLDCDALAPSERDACLRYLDNIALANAHGSATALGGISRLRSYPENRYQGAHTEFVGGEIRWNLTNEAKPFNLYVMKDIRTTVQIAFFYEIGSVGETRGDLWQRTRSTYGAGGRVVTASGLVYRIDFTSGDEGFQPSIFFQYPWQL